jgi:excisionase family DNA binding protein
MKNSNLLNARESSILASTAETFSTLEASAYLGVAVSTLSIWRNTKRYPLPYIKVGRLVRYRKSDLDAFMASRTVSA